MPQRKKFCMGTCTVRANIIIDYIFQAVSLEGVFMNTKLLFIVTCLFVGAAMAADPALKTEKEKLSYALGLQVGTNLKQSEVDIDSAILARAVKDALSGAKPLLSEEEIRATLQDFQQKMVQKQMAHMQQVAAKNKKEGDAFLAANKKKKGVVTLPNGLQYKVVKNGTGKKPKLNDTVVAHYTGTLINGKEFDSSVSRGQPATFPLNGVIKGWQEALQLMPEGSKWQVFIPAELGYGERGAGQHIEPNSTLVFDIELLSVKPGDQNQKPN